MDEPAGIDTSLASMLGDRRTFKEKRRDIIYSSHYMDRAYGRSDPGLTSGHLPGYDTRYEAKGLKNISPCPCVASSSMARWKALVKWSLNRALQVVTRHANRLWEALQKKDVRSEISNQSKFIGFYFEMQRWWRWNAWKLSAWLSDIWPVVSHLCLLSVGS